MRTFSFVLLAEAVAVAACGGKAVVDGTSGGGGQTGASTTTSTHTITSTTTSTGSGGSGSCPDPFFGIGSMCTSPGATCELELSCCGQHAICQNGTWQNGGPYCQQDCPTPCGSGAFGCVAGALCVVAETDIGTGYLCAANPCSAAPSCACAGSVCPSYLSCMNVSGNSVSCACPNC
jgi:hypothetical protein